MPDDHNVYEHNDVPAADDYHDYDTSATDDHGATSDHYASAVHDGSHHYGPYHVHDACTFDHEHNDQHRSADDDYEQHDNYDHATPGIGPIQHAGP